MLEARSGMSSMHFSFWDLYYWGTFKLYLLNIIIIFVKEIHYLFKIASI